MLCTLGLHKLDPVVDWNGGHYFTRCLRCRRDFIRTLSGPWHEPHDCRVVWRRIEPCPPPVHSKNQPLGAPAFSIEGPVEPPAMEPRPAHNQAERYNAAEPIDGATGATPVQQDRVDLPAPPPDEHSGQPTPLGEPGIDLPAERQAPAPERLAPTADELVSAAGAAEPPATEPTRPIEPDPVSGPEDTVIGQGHPPARGLWNESFMDDDDEEDWWRSSVAAPQRTGEALPAAAHQKTQRTQ